MNNRRTLGRSPITISTIGLGCWQFSEGRGLANGYWPGSDVTRQPGKALTSLRGQRVVLRTSP